MSFGVHPVILIVGVTAALALVTLVSAFVVRHGGLKACLFAFSLVLILPGIFVLLALNPALIDGRFRTYRALYRDIQIGMTRDEVLAAVAGHYPNDGKRRPPKIIGDTPEALSFFMDPETSREPNCEGIFLKLDHGKVTQKVYSRD